MDDGAESGLEDLAWVGLELWVESGLDGGVEGSLVEALAWMCGSKVA